MKRFHIFCTKYLTVIGAMIVFCLGGISQLRAQVTIYNPTPSTVVDLGQTLSITWNTNVTGGTVSIELYKGGADYATIATSIANNHSYDWVVPSTLHGGNDYQIYISSSTSGNALSPNFTIAYSLNVTSGNNTMVSAGEQMGFSWSTTLNQGYLNLDYKNASGGWTSIASNVAYTATPYTWTTPSGSNYVSPTEVRITSTADPSLVAYVQNITLTKTLNLTSPSSATNLIVGDMLPVRWSSNYTGASGQSVKIELYKGGVLNQTLSASTTNDGSYDWPVKGVANANDYQIKLIDGSGTPSVTSGNFTLGGGSTSEPVRVISYNSYDSFGNVLKTTDAKGNVTRYYYGSDQHPFTQDSLNGAYGAYLTGISRPDQGGADSLTTSAQYNNLGQMTQMTREDNVTHYFAYDDYGRLTAVKNNAGQTLQTYTYTYTGSSFNSSNPNWIRTAKYVSSTDSLTTTSYFDGLGRAIQTQTRDGSNDIVKAQSYDAMGRLWKSWKAYSRNTGHSYDASDSAHAAGYYSNINGYPYSEKQYEASPLNRLVALIPDGGQSISGSVTTSYGVGALNGNNYDVTTITDESSKITKTWTDGWGRKVQTASDPSNINAITSYYYDVLGRLDSTIAPNNVTSKYFYNARGELVQKQNPDAGTSQYKYDADKNLRFSQDSVQANAGTVVFQTYDGLGRKLVMGLADTTFSGLVPDTYHSFESDTSNQQSINAWDSKPSISKWPWNKFVSQINSVTVSNSKGKLVARAFRFGGSGIPATATLQGVGVTGSESYQAADSISVSNTIVDNGASLNLSAGGQIILKPGFTANQGSSVDAKIDASLSGKATEGVSSLTGSNPWQVTMMSYDNEGRISDKWIWTGDQRAWDTHIMYLYDWQGDLTQMEDSVDGKTFYQFYAYNQLGQLDSVFINTTPTKPTTPEVTYTYTPDGKVASVNYRGGKGENFAYDIRDRVTTINNVSNTSSFGAFYTYAKNGNITKAEYMNPDVPGGSGNQYHYAYSYDNLNRLTGATFGFGSTGTSSDFELSGLSYDKSGNIKALARRDQSGTLIDNLSYTYANGSDEITEVVDGAASTPSLDWDAESASYGYDDNGNLTSRSDKINKISYDWRNLPIDFDLTGGQEIVDNYNAGGQRILKELKGGAWTFYVKDGNKTLAVIESDTVNNHFNLFGNGLFGRYEPSNGARRYYLKDNLGSTRMVTDNNGSILQTFDYYPFGLLMPGRSGGSGSTMEKFTGKELDDEAGLNLDYFGARYYDAAVGRFLSTDPYSFKYPSLNSYQYTFNNPVNLIDINGDTTRIQESNGDYLYYTPGAKYTGNPNDKVAKARWDMYNKINKTKAGHTVLSRLSNSKLVYDYNIGSPSDSRAAASFQGTKNGGNLRASKGVGIDQLAHELFHAYQRDYNFGGLGQNINKEIGAYLFEAIFSYQYSHNDIVFQGIDGQINQFSGAMNYLRYTGFSWYHYLTALTNFKTQSAINNPSHLYDNFGVISPLKLPDPPIIKFLNK